MDDAIQVDTGYAHRVAVQNIGAGEVEIIVLSPDGDTSAFCLSPEGVGRLRLALAEAVGVILLEPIDHAMLLIKTIDSSAHLEFSEYTRQWYVGARIEISDGACLNRGTEHRATPDEAVLAFLDRLKTVPVEQIVVTNGPVGRRHWRWNGAGFAQEPVEWFKSRVRTGGFS